MKRIYLVALCGVVSLACVFIYKSDAEGCAAVRRIDGPSISIAEESAVIIWNPAKKVQHFIRRAAFDTKSPDFGFLVPTPTLPKLPLAEVEDSIFREMDRWMLPKTVEQTRWQFDLMLNRLGCGATKSRDMAVAAKDSVRVLHEQKVGGFETAILEADNTEDLSNWLKKNGYSNDPELQSWLAPYLGARWKITAFKIMQDPKSGMLATTKAVRMSFETERPFFPYREPEGKKDDKEIDRHTPGSRLLRVLLVSDGRMDGMHGHQGWHADVKWSDALSDEQRKQLAKETGIADDELPATVWMTSFEDRASPRPGTEEVYFDPAKDQTPIVPPPFVKYNDVFIPIDCSLMALAVLVIFAVGIISRWRKQPA